MSLLWPASFWHVFKFRLPTHWVGAEEGEATGAGESERFRTHRDFIKEIFHHRDGAGFTPGRGEPKAARGAAFQGRSETINHGPALPAGSAGSGVKSDEREGGGADHAPRPIHDA